MTAPCAGSELTAAMPARLEDAESFLVVMREFLTLRGLEPFVFALELLAREALVNAVQHGCQSDPARSVTVRLSVLPGRLRLCVSDDGPGFDWRGALRVLPGPASESGRGLCIMHSYAHAVEFNEAGNTVCFTKYLPVEEVQVSDDLEGLKQVALETSVSAKNVQPLREMFQGLLQGGVRRLVLDFSRVESIDSVGIGLLVATHNSLVKVGGSLSLANVGQDIYQLLTLMRLDKHFGICRATAEPAS